MRLFHLVAPTVWAEAGRVGRYEPPSLASEGFVHFSFADQVSGTANLLYRDEPELIVVEVDGDEFAAYLRVEDSYGSGTEFPHVYAPVPTAAAVATHRLTRAADGDWVFSPGGAGAAASPDR